MANSHSDLDFYFDPVCPFAWMTSKWVRMVAEQRDYGVDWRFISLRMLNAHIDYDAHFPPEYEAGHTAGLRLLRVAARPRRARPRSGRARCTRRWAAGYSTATREADPTGRVGPGQHGSSLEPMLPRPACRTELADALDDTSLDAEIRAETDEALALTGKDVGTPILHFQPPTGVGVLRPGDQPPAEPRGRGPAVGPRAWAWPVPAASPSSSAACASGRSSPASGSTPNRSAIRRTGTAAAGAPRGS